jgi:glycosyltransferase involved in cell wall biosynthesis
MNSSIDRVRILYIIDGIEFGGGERVFLQLATGLGDRFDASVAAMPGGTFAQKVSELGIHFHPVDMSRQLSLKPIFQLKNIFSTESIDLIHSQGARADFFARVAGRLAGAPHIICTIAAPVERFDVPAIRKTIYRLLDRLTEHYVERFIVVSNTLKQNLTKLRGINSRKVIKIYNGIELKQYRPQIQLPDLRHEFGISRDAPLIAFIGRMVWEKGLEYFIQSIPIINQRAPNARFLLVGDGPLRQQAELLVQSLDIEKKVTFTGFRSDISRVLATIDILVIPSLFEGFPMITLEAMAMAKAIVATNIPGITEQISNGEEGILVPSRNPEALAVAILRLVQDSNLSVSIGSKAQQKVENCFSIEKMIRETKNIYQSLLKSSSNE